MSDVKTCLFLNILLNFFYPNDIVYFVIHYEICFHWLSGSTAGIRYVVTQNAIKNLWAGEGQNVLPGNEFSPTGKLTRSLQLEFEGIQNFQEREARTSYTILARDITQIVYHLN